MRIGKLLVVGLLAWSVTLSAADYLTEGVDSARTGWVRDETTLSPSNVGGMKLLWTITLDSTPREMHNLFSPLGAGRSRDRGRRRRLGRSVRHRRRRGPADLAHALRKHLHTDRPERRHALPRRTNGSADRCAC
jgi:hypothetical protein